MASVTAWGRRRERWRSTATSARAARRKSVSSRWLIGLLQVAADYDA